MAFAAFALIALGVLLLGIVARDAITGRHDIVSLRSVFFASFALFQIVSGLRVTLTGEFADYPLSDPDSTSTTFAVACWIFMLIFLGAYGSGFIAKHLARALPGENASPNPASLLMLAAVILASGVLFKNVLIYVPIFGPLSDKIGGGQLALAVGLAVWAWAPRLLNPVIAAYAGAVVLVALGSSVMGNYGRRDLVSVLAVAPWAMYHAWWKFGGFSFAMKRLAVIGAAGIVCLAAYTSIRSHRLSDAGLGAIASNMRGADVKGGIMELTHGQYSANISMWVIDTRPAGYPYDTLHSLEYFSTIIIPRQFYPSKPEGLGMAIPDQIHLRGRSGGFSVGPGVIGHAFNDNPWIALWLYPVLLGLAFRFADESLYSRPRSTFLILPAGVALGEIVGLARGELALFAFNAASAMVAAYASMLAIRWLLHQFGWRPTFETDEHWADEDTDWHDTYTDADEAHAA